MILSYVWDLSAIWKSFERYFFEPRYLFAKLLNFFILRFYKYLESFYLILSLRVMNFKVKIWSLSKALKENFWFLKIIHILSSGIFNKIWILVILSKITIILSLVLLFVLIKFHFSFILLAPFSATRRRKFLSPLLTISAQKRITVSPLELICLNVVMILWFWSI